MPLYDSSPVLEVRGEVDVLCQFVPLIIGDAAHFEIPRYSCLIRSPGISCYFVDSCLLHQQSYTSSIKDHGDIVMSFDGS